MSAGRPAALRSLLLPALAAAAFFPALLSLDSVTNRWLCDTCLPTRLLATLWLAYFPALVATAIVARRLWQDPTWPRAAAFVAIYTLVGAAASFAYVHAFAPDGAARGAMLMGICACFSGVGTVRLGQRLAPP